MRRRLIRVGGQVAGLVVVTLGILSLLFFIIRLSGDPAAILAGPGASPEQIDQTRHALGLDRPLWMQYREFLADTLTLRLGDSLLTQRPALDMVLDRLPATLLLAGSTLLTVLVVAVPVGAFAARYHGRLGGRAVALLTAVVQAVPNFLLGIGLIWLFSLYLGWLPTFGSGTAAQLVLPTLTLAAFTGARVARLLRTELLEDAGADWMRTARAKGVPGLRILVRHALRHAALPVLALLTVEVSYLVSGAVVVETLYAYGGIGKQLVDAVFNRDYPVVQATVLVVAVGVIVINAVGEWLMGVLDPRTTA
ncbi:ABC transporter permease [Dactylosporangium sp. AC04546]|uniref:ABC transporter permease n=1 Tax=Dactylosporangium sp. AC04546 TaxID=2862460 RepID=UPI001EE04E9B|nr:ABC transporter permease [Dactylosporangium sp. AC04546]WVK78443.1 ABC transporter permease [Dactylosporangium sp. AC04546]